MLNWLPTELLAKQVAKFTATRLNALSSWRLITSGCCSILGIDPVAPLDSDYLPEEYCFERAFKLLIPSTVETLAIGIR